MLSEHLHTDITKQMLSEHLHTDITKQMLSEHLHTDITKPGLYWVATRVATHFPQWAGFFKKKTRAFKKVGFYKKI